MSNDYIKEIINNHKRKGMLEEAICVTIIDNHLVKYNKFNLRIQRLNGSMINTSLYNAQVVTEVKRDSALYKETREFNLLFRFFNKLGINKGYIKKTERPDFEFSKDGISYGIEVTRLYTGNDWVAEKLHNEIVAYSLTSKQFKEYVSNSRYHNRIKTTNNDKGIKVEAIKDKNFEEQEIIQIKNKIFEKIRKQLDDYQKYDFNYIFAEIFYAGYKQIESYSDLSNEINYFVSHLDANFDKTEFHLILKNGNVYVDFDLKNRNYKFL